MPKEPEVVEVEVEEVETPIEPEPVAPEWVQVYEDSVSTMFGLLYTYVIVSPKVLLFMLTLMLVLFMVFLHEPY